MVALGFLGVVLGGILGFSSIFMVMRTKKDRWLVLLAISALLLTGAGAAFILSG